MKIAIIGANGNQGKLLVKEALNKGFDVTGIVRDKSKITENINIIEKDLFELNYDDVKDFDVIISSFAAWTPETAPLHKKSAEFLSNLLAGKPNRLLIVGGAGSLYVNKEHTVSLLDTPDFPNEYKLVASAMLEGLKVYKNSKDVNWTYLSPAAMFNLDGERTGKYILGDEELILNSKGESSVSYADFAIAMIDEAEKGNYIKKRFTVVSE